MKVLDFGLAAEIRHTLSRLSKKATGTSGTRPYMAPEQWRGDVQGAAADQYALAVLCHELVSGRVPFHGVFGSHDETVMRGAVLNEAPEPLPHLSRSQNRTLLRALAKEPSERFATCGDFIATLEGKKVRRVRRTGARASRGRRRPPAAAAAMVLCVLAAVIGVLLLQRHRVEQGRIGAEQERLAAEQSRVAAEKKRDAEERGRVAAEKEARVTAERQAEGEASVAEEARVAALAKEKDRQIERALSKAREAKGRGELLAASEAVKQLLALDPEHAAGQALHREIKEEIGMRETAPVRGKAEVEHAKAMKLDHSDGSGDELDEMDTKLRTANAYFLAKAYDEALEGYRAVLPECVRLTKLDAERQAARDKRGNAEQAREECLQVHAATEARDLWEEAEALRTSARTEFDKRQFNEAGGLFAQAATRFAQVRAHATATEKARAAIESPAARAAKAAYEREWAKLDQRYMTTAGPAIVRGKEIARITEEAERLMGEGKFREATLKWQEAVVLVQREKRRAPGRTR